MASDNKIEVVIVARDEASGEMKEVARGLMSIGDAAKEANKKAQEPLDDAKKAVKGVGDQAEETGRALDYSLGEIAANAAMKLADALSGVFEGMISGAMDSEKNIAQLDAVLRSTKGAAGMTSDSVQALATSLSKLTMFEDDAIVGAESILLTFTSIGKQVFPDATKTVLDMSQALGQDLKSSAIQLGKALNDPIAGVSALSRVGVNFTEDQKKMIEELVKSGKVLEAQKLILKELQVEFGGSAEAAGQTFAGSLERLRNAWGNLMETVGGALTQNEHVKNIIDKLATAVDGLSDKFLTLSDSAQLGIVGIVGALWLLGKALPSIAIAKVAFGGAGAVIAGAGAAGAAGAGATGAAAAGATAATAATTAAAGATAATAATATTAATGGFMAVITGIVVAIKGALVPAFASIAAALGAPIAAPLILLVGLLAILGGTIYLFGAEAAKTAGMLAEIFGALFARLSREIITFGVNFFFSTGEILKWTIQLVLDVLAKFDEMKTKVGDALKTMMDGMKTKFQAGLDTVKGWGNSLKTIFTNLVTSAKTWGKNIVDGIWTGIKGAWEALKTNVKTLLDNLMKFVQNAIGAKSPSTVYAAQVGAPMAAGIGQGFTQAMGRQVAPAMAGAMQPSALKLNNNVGRIQIYGSLSQGERSYFDSRANNIAEKALERMLK